ncbi:glycosyltransferase family 2 protein [Pyramidobacter sp.]|uniref:glycosyltransferase family 2 protein n=1 Tax=Pyramidobacter sp. TaxID=1943581 RepID=UPI0025EF4FDA|nr:glycosyltransferase [Pyramidobacter sp.]MDY3212232.1 glycosyltransferase [Pyramidobacter sp.]
MKPLMDKQKSSCVVMKQNQAGQLLVSVVVPTYNVEEYLKDMLRSVLRQSLTQLEVICVNDGSTDASLDVLMRWAAKEPRISVLSQENAGLSAARNQLRTKEKVIHDLQRSVSFRLGRILTWAPRKARGGVRCWRDHGLAHTLRRALRHLGLKK